jgi:hypothetical protein
MTLVTKLRLVAHLRTETPFRMEGVSPGGEPPAYHNYAVIQAPPA